jgi:hypothetical protein
MFKSHFEKLFVSTSRDSVLDCGSPLPLFRRDACDAKSARGLAQSKTSRIFIGNFFMATSEK